MDISIFGYKLNLEILILIGIVYLILVGHMFCGCCHFGMSEGFDVSGNVTKPAIKNDNLPTQTAAGTSGVVDTINTTKTVPTTKEGFVGANINYGESSIYNLDGDKPIDTSSWAAPNLTVVPGQPLNPAVKAFLDREPQPVPLPEGELSMFANTPFKPECCPNTYSNSSGCACMTGQQYNYLILRGGNNVPYSEY